MGKAKQASKTSNVDKSARTAANKARRVARMRRKSLRSGELIADHRPGYGGRDIGRKALKNWKRRQSQAIRARAAKCASWRQYQAKRAPRFSSTVEVVKPAPFLSAAMAAEAPHAAQAIVDGVAAAIRA
jgi:hypothetical protein